MNSAYSECHVDIMKAAHSLAVGGFDFYGKSTENIYMQLKPIELILGDFYSSENHFRLLI